MATKKTGASGKAAPLDPKVASKLLDKLGTDNEFRRLFKKDPKAAARQLMPEFGFGAGQWSCLDRLWIGESGWKWNAENPSSGAYGIPQSLPARKMATMGKDYRTNPVTQIRWGLDYIKKSYGTPCNALSKWNSRSPHWY